MCKKGNQLIGINRVVLGQRLIGFEMWSIDKQEVVGLTEKGLRDVIEDGAIVYGMSMSEDGKFVKLDDDFNMMQKTGVGNFEPLKESDTMLNDIFSFIGRTASGDFEFINPRWGRKVLNETKLTALLEIAAGSINGVKIQDGKLVTWFDGEQAPAPAPMEQEASKKK